jgi:hypothetical protein
MQGNADSLQCSWKNSNKVMCISGSVTSFPQYEYCSSQSIGPLQPVLGMQKQYLAWKCSKNTDYLIHDIFKIPSLSLIVHELAE